MLCWECDLVLLLPATYRHDGEGLTVKCVKCGAEYRMAIRQIKPATEEARKEATERRKARVQKPMAENGGIHP